MPDYADIADRLEFLVWAEDAPRSKSTLKEDLQALLASADSAEAEELAAQVFEILQERKTMLGAKYPFSVSMARLASLPTNDDGIPYLFCLACSVVTHKAITPDVRDLMFEQLACSAAESYFGGKGIQTGARARKHGHASFGHMVKAVGSMIKELGQPLTTLQPGGGDGGWDVILVKNFTDGLYPRLIVGGNCATGKTDWEKKGQETVFPHWFRHFYDREPYGPYLEFFAAPFVADDDQRSRKTGKETFLFDRFRLAEHGNTQDGMLVWLETKAKPEAAQITLF